MKKDKAPKSNKQRDTTKPHKTTQPTWSWRTLLKKPKLYHTGVSKADHIRMWGIGHALPKSRKESKLSQWLVKADDNKEQHLTTTTNNVWRARPNKHNLQGEQQHQAWFTILVHDILGIGKAMEMALGLFLAHDAFLSRRPFKLQCAILAWEGIVVLTVLWAVMRVIGLAEVMIWGVDDLARGTLGAIQTVGRSLISLLEIKVW